MFNYSNTNYFYLNLFISNFNNYQQLIIYLINNKLLL